MRGDITNINTKIVIAFIQIILIFSIGTFGFNYLLQDISLLEALYLTVITLTTVGYGDISPFANAHPDERAPALIFAIILMILGISSFVYAAGILTQYVTSGELRRHQRIKKMLKKISRFSDHYIIIGASETGCYIADELSLLKRPYVIVDTSFKALDDYASNDKSIYYIQGDATEENILLKAGIAKAKRIAITLPSPKDSLFLIMTLKEMATKNNWNFEIIAKCPNTLFEKKYTMAGVDYIIKSDISVADQIITELYRPASKTFIDRLRNDKTQIVRIDEVTISTESSLANTLLKNSLIKKKTGLIICAVKDFTSGEWHINPDGEYLLEPGDILIFVGNLKSSQKLRRIAENV